MPIVYDKLFNLLKEKGYTTYKIRQEKLIGQGTLTAIKNGTGGLDAKTIARLCEVLDCQPGDLMEYVKEPTAEADRARDQAGEDRSSRHEGGERSRRIPRSVDQSQREERRVPILLRSDRQNASP